MTLPYRGLYRIRASTHLRALCANIATAHLQDIVCVCERERERERARARARAIVCDCVRLCASGYVCLCVVCVFVCISLCVYIFGMRECTYIPRIISWNFALSNSPVLVRCLPEILKHQSPSISDIRNYQKGDFTEFLPCHFR